MPDVPAQSLDDLPLQVRQWTCPIWRALHDRDHNAAKGVLAAGRAASLDALTSVGTTTKVVAVESI
jgi:hypothetical protein